MANENIFYVYVGDHPLTGDPCYFGKGQRKRVERHGLLLRAGKHDNPHLQAIYNKYGEIKWSVVCSGLSEQEALSTEIALIAHFGRTNSQDGLLANRTAGGDGILGHIHSVETRLKMKKPKSEAHREALRLANLGKKASAETRAQMRAAKLGKVRTPEHCANLSATLKGRGPTSEVLAKATLANTGRVQTQAEREMRRMKNTGQKRSAEIIARMKIAQQKRFSADRLAADPRQNREGLAP